MIYEEQPLKKEPNSSPREQGAVRSDEDTQLATGAGEAGCAASGGKSSVDDGLPQDDAASDVKSPVDDVTAIVCTNKASTVSAEERLWSATQGRQRQSQCSDAASRPAAYRGGGTGRAWFCLLLSLALFGALIIGCIIGKVALGSAHPDEDQGSSPQVLQPPGFLEPGPSTTVTVVDHEVSVDDHPPANCSDVDGPPIHEFPVGSPAPAPKEISTPRVFAGGGGRDGVDRSPSSSPATTRGAPPAAQASGSTSPPVSISPATHADAPISTDPPGWGGPPPGLSPPGSSSSPSGLSSPASPPSGGSRSGGPPSGTASGIGAALIRHWDSVSSGPSLVQLSSSPGSPSPASSFSASLTGGRAGIDRSPSSSPATTRGAPSAAQASGNTSSPVSISPATHAPISTDPPGWGGPPPGLSPPGSSSSPSGLSSPGSPPSGGSRSGVVQAFPSFCRLSASLTTKQDEDPAKSAVLQAVRKKGLNLRNFPDFQDDAYVVWAAVVENGLALQYASETLRNESDVVHAAVASNGLALEYASATRRNDSETVSVAVEGNGLALEYASATVQADRGVVLTAVAQNCLALQFVSESLRKDKDVVLAATVLTPPSPSSAPGPPPPGPASEAVLWRDVDTPLVSSASGPLVSSSTHHFGGRASGPLVTRRVDTGGMAALPTPDASTFNLISKRGRPSTGPPPELSSPTPPGLSSPGSSPSGDPPPGSSSGSLAPRWAELSSSPLVSSPSTSSAHTSSTSTPRPLPKSPISPVQVSTGGGFEAIARCQQEDINRKVEAIAMDEKDGLALRDLFLVCSDDRDVVLEAVRQNAFALRYASAELRADRGIVLEAVRQNASALHFASAELRAGRGVVLEAVRHNAGDGVAFLQAPSSLRRDRGFVLDAMEQNFLVLDWVNNEFYADEAFMLAAVRKSSEAFHYASAALKVNKDFVWKAVQENSDVLLWVSDEFFADEAFMLEAVRQSAKAFLYASDTLQANRNFVWKAVQENSDVLGCVSDKFVADEGFMNRNFMRKAVQKNSDVLLWAPDIVGPKSLLPRAGTLHV